MGSGPSIPEPRKKLDHQDSVEFDSSARDAKQLDEFPLSPAQRGIWYSQHLDPEVPINIAQYLDIRGDLDPAVVLQGAELAGVGFGSGHLRIVERDGEPFQVVDYSLDVLIPSFDYRDKEDPAAAAIDWMRADYSKPIDLVKDRLIIGAVFRIDEARYFWYQRVHHIVLDGYGAVTTVNRIAEGYSSIVEGREAVLPNPGDLRAMVENEVAYRDSTRFQTDKAYWAERVRGLESGSSLTGRTAAPAPINGIATATLSTEESTLLDEAGTKHESSSAGLLIAAFATYMAQITGTEEVILSLPVTARTTAVMRRSGGMISNVVPMRLKVGYDTTVAELLEAVTVEVTGALRHQRYRHEDIRRDASSDTHNTKEFFGPWVNIMLFQTAIQLGPITGQLNVLSTGSIEDLGVNFYQSVAESESGTEFHIDFETNPNL